MIKKFENMFNRRVVALLLAMVTLTTALPIEVLASQAPVVRPVAARTASGAQQATVVSSEQVAQMGAQQAITNGVQRAMANSLQAALPTARAGLEESTPLQEVTISSGSTIQSLADGDTIVVGADGTAMLENSAVQSAMPAAASPLAEQAMKTAYVESRNSMLTKPEMAESPLVYDEAAEEYAENNSNLTYKGSIRGTDLAAYEVAMDEDAVEMDGIMTAAEVNELRTYYEAEIPDAGQMAGMMGDADAFSESVKQMAAKDSGFYDDLAKNEQTTLFSVIHIDPASGQMPDDIAAATSTGHRDSGDGIAVRDSGGAAPETEVFIVDDTTLMFVVRDTAGAGINGVAVTVVINDKTYKGITKTSNGVDGVAIIENMAGLHSGFISLERDGYRIITEEDVDIVSGAPRKYTMVKTTKDDFYVRAMSIGGADMMNKDAALWLTPTKIDEAFSITITLANGENANRLNGTDVILTLKRKGGDTKELARIKPTRKVGNYSQQYEISGKWAELGNNQQFQDGDTLVITDTAGHTLAQPKLQVKNSPLQDKGPFYKRMDYSLFGKFGFTLPKDIPVVGDASFKADIMDVKFTLVVNPSGKGMFCYNTEFDKVVTEKEFYTKPFNPRKEEKTEKAEKSTQSKFEKKLEQFKNGRAQLPKAGKTAFTSSNVGADVNGAISGLVECDWQKGDFKINTGAMIGVEGHYSMTYYLVMPPVPPVYAGFNVMAGGSAVGGVGVKFNRHDIANTLSIRFGGDGGYSFTPHIGLALYAGVGIHGLACVEGRGSVDFEYMLSVTQGATPPIGADFVRRRLNIQFDITIEAVLLILKASKTWKTPKYNLADNWGQGGKLDPTQLQEETKLYEVRFPGSEAEAGSSAANATTGALASAVSGTVAAQPDDVYANGEDASDGYTTAVADTVSANMPIRWLKVGNTRYLFRIAYMKYYSWGLVYPTVVYQKENPDGKSFENKLYMVPYLSAPSGYTYDYDFDVCVLPGDKGNEVMLCIQSGYQKTFGNTAEYIASNTVMRGVRLSMPDNKLIQQKALSGSTAYVRSAPRVGQVGDGLLGFTWLESPSLGSVGTQPGSSAEYKFYDVAKAEFMFNGGSVIYPNGVITEMRVGKTKEFDREWYSAASAIVVRFGEQGAAGTYYDIRTVKLSDPEPLAREKDAISNLQFIRGTDPILSGVRDQSIDGLMYSAGGQLKVMHSEISSGKAMGVINPDGTPFLLPAGCTTYQYLSGTVNGKTAMKLIALYKQTTGEGAAAKTDSILNVYNIETSQGKIIAHGPRAYTLKDQVVSRMDAMIQSGTNNPGLQIVYTANNVSKVLKESEMSGGKIEPGIVEEASTMYRWNELYSISAKATKLLVENPIINKTEKTIKAELVVENTGTERSDAFTYEIKDNNGDVVKKDTKNVVTYPGESVTIDASFPLPDKWTVGAMKLTAQVVSSTVPGPNGDQTVAITGGGDAVWEVKEAEDCSLDMEVTQQVLDSGHYAVASFQNESIAPSADETYLRIYTVRDNDIATATEPSVFEFKLGALAIAERSDFSENWMDMRSNMILPLDDYWNDPDCSGVIVELSSVVPGNSEATKVTRAMLENPKAPHRFMVSAYASNAKYGTVEGGGYSLPGTALTLQATPNEGYRFVGWKDEAGSIVSTNDTYPLTVTDSPTTMMQAVFEEDGTRHRITLIPNAHQELVEKESFKVENGVALAQGLVTAPDNQNISYVVKHGESVTIMATPIFGYAFVAWQDEDGRVLSNKSSYTFNAMREMTIHAVFKSETETSTVYFDATTNGGTSTVTSMETDENGKLATLPTAQKRGAAFRGWYTAASGGTRATASTVYTGDTVLYAQFSGGSSGGGSGSKSTQTFDFDYASPEVKDGKVDAAALAKSAAEALKAGGKYVLVRNAKEISPEAMKTVYNAANKLSIYADTTVNGATTLRLYLNPALGKDIKSSILLGGTVNEAAVKTLFERYYNNKLAVLHLNQNGTFGMPVGIAARMDLSGLDTKTLYFYSYNRETNKYYRINTKYSIDANGFLRFTTTLAGSVIVTDKPLTAKAK